MAIDFTTASPRCLATVTGQTIRYAKETVPATVYADDDGHYELGVSRRWLVRDTADQAGTTNIVINGKTHALSNNTVVDLRKHLEWARYVPLADIGPAANGKLFWEQWPLGPVTDISFTAATKVINSVAGSFSTSALCVGRKFTVSGSTNNDGTYTVTAITVNNCTVSEALIDEAAGASVSFATVADLVWDFLDQANINQLGGHNDWRIPNYLELPSIVNVGNCNPAIDTTIFPSTPSSYHWSSSTHPCNSTNAWGVHFSNGSVYYGNKRTNKYYVRLVRGGVS